MDELSASEDEEELWGEEVEVDIDTLDACPAEKRPAEQPAGTMKRLKSRMEQPGQSGFRSDPTFPQPTYSTSGSNGPRRTAKGRSAAAAQGSAGGGGGA